MNNSIKSGRLCGTEHNHEVIPAMAYELNRVSPDGFKEWAEHRNRPTWLVDAVLLPSSEWLPSSHAWWECALAYRIRQQLEKELDDVAEVVGMGFGLIECPTGEAYGWYHKVETQKPDEGLAGGGTFRRVPVCQNCGAEDVIAVANARWNVVTQAWEMYELVDEYGCGVCSTETNGVDWNEADTDLSPDELAARYGGAGHPEHTFNHWAVAVASRATVQGYWAWVYDQLNPDTEV